MSDAHLEGLLIRTREALAREIRANPDKSWLSTLPDRYRQFLREHNRDCTLAPLETWPDGAAELTEAFLRGYDGK